MQKKWYIKDNLYDINTNNINPLIQTILLQRGLNNKEIKKFLYGSIDDLYDPYLMPDLKKGVERIIRALNNKEKIIIYGDYDVDGITSTALLYTYFKRSLGYEVGYYLPNRLKEGYGLNMEAIKKIVKKGYDLIITVDCGITRNREVEYAREEGIDVIVTDHHQPGDSLPGALAVIDPHRRDGKYPFKELAGVGVAFKLCQGIEKKIKGKSFSSDLDNLLDLVALGSIADIVPLRGENRILVKEGLRLLPHNNTGVRALIKKTGLEGKNLNAGQIGYIIAPPLNAAGRMDDPEMGIELLVSESVERANDIAEKLVKINRNRQDEEERILNEAREMVNGLGDGYSSIILASENWHHGVIGIVASRLVEEYYRPTILIAIEDGIGKGSCRSIPGLNIYDALSACSEELRAYGGHAMAAGLEIEVSKLETFRRKFDNYLKGQLTDEDFIPKLKLDGILNPQEINIELYNDLEELKPFGVGNPRPKFLLNNVKLSKIFSIGKDGKHLKFSLQNGLKGIGFGFGKMKNNLINKKLDLAFTLNLNEWNGMKELQINLEDVHIRDEIDTYPVIFKMEGCSILDKRGCKDHIGYIKNIYKGNKKIAVFINNLSLYKSFKNKLGREKVFLINKREEYNIFLQKESGILMFSNTDIREGSVVDELVISSLPFSINELGEIFSLFAGEKTNIHLLFGKEQVKINQEIIKKMLPSDKFLRRLYLLLKSFPKKDLLYSEINKLISKEVNYSFEKRMVNTSLTIFKEIGLIEDRGDRFRFRPSSAERLDLSNSIRYNDTIEIINKFREFVNLVFKNNLFELILRLRKGGNIDGFEKNYKRHS